MKLIRGIFVLILACVATITFAQVPDGPIDIPGMPPVEIPDQDGPELPTPERPSQNKPNQGNNDDDSETGRIGIDDVDDGLTDEEQRKRKIGLGKGVGKIYDSIGIYGHDYLRTNNFEMYERATDVKVQDNYILGAGDNITVSVWNNADVENDNFTISEEGYIESSAFDTRKGFGRIYLAGTTLGKAREILRSQYSKYYTFDIEDFVVSLTGTHLINVNILGEVEEPGSWTIPAINTLFSVLKLSGGPTENGSVRNIEIRRDGEVIDVLDVYEYLTKGQNRHNIYLQDNDVIYVPQIGKVVEMEGAVKRNTSFELKDRESFADLLYYSGGFKPNALKNRVQLFRFEEEEYLIKDYSYNPENPNSFEGKLADGDQVIIKEIEPEANNIVITEGALNQTGYYEFEPGMRVLDLIEKSNGLRFDAVTSRAYVTRFNEDLQAINMPIILDSILANPDSEENIILYPKDELEILSKSDFADKFRVDIYGQVKKPGSYLFGNNLTMQDLLIKAGGFRTDALTQEIELRRVVDYSEEEGRLVPVRDVVEKFKVDYNFLNPDNPNNKLDLQPYDQIFVRSIPEFEDPQTVSVGGEVKLPGRYPILEKDLRISDVIEDAGGLTPYAYKEGAQFYRITDSTVTKYDTVKINKDSSYVRKYTARERTSRPYIIDLNEVFQRESSEHNLVLKPGDRLIIPTVDETVSIGGAIRRVVDDTTWVNTAYQGSKNAKWYIQNMGAGFDDDALKRTTQVVYPNGQAKGTKKFLFFNLYPEVEPGSEISVDYKPKREKSGLSKFFGDLTAEKTIALLSSSATTAALVYAVLNGRRR